MLPALPVIDLLSVQPDADGLDIWAEDFDRNSVPAGIGVYCFYDPTTGMPHYIGSGCAIHANGVGVWRRILDYRKGPKQFVAAHNRRIGEAVRTLGLRLKVWLVASNGDARKYEMDAIAKYRPSLNKVGADDPTQTLEAERAQAQACHDRSRAKWLGVYDPNAVKPCSRCKTPKKCSEYRRCDGFPFGVHRACKTCEKLSRAQIKQHSVEGAE